MGQNGDSARERERRHLAWLNQGDNADRLFGESQRLGRGFWFVSDRLPSQPGQTPIAFFTVDQLAEFPEGSERDVIADLLRTYKPKVQMVFVVEDGGQISAYKIRGLRQS